jgi:NAD(P)-dependent dehydrogenase (short-subunit alcohol dehydrogenase family)
MTAPLALITGGQQGIGLGIAQALAGAGFRIAIASLPDPDHPSVTAGLATLPPGTAYHPFDLSRADTAAAMVAQVTADAGPIATFVQNAGIPARVRGDMLDVTPDNFDAVMAVNLRGAFFAAQAVARHMLDQPAPHYRSIAFVTSVSARMASPERADYCISKAGAAMAAQALALRLAPHGIGVFELRPGIIATDMTAAVRDRYTDRIHGGLVPEGRWGDPADIGRIVVPLATGQFQFAIGAVIPVDGGLSIERL